MTPPDELVTQAQHEEPGTTEKKTCCSVKKPAVPKKIAPPNASVRWLLTIQMKRCQGMTGEEGGPVPGCPPAAHISWQFEWLTVAMIPNSSEAPVDFTILPIIPPPRNSST